MKRLGIVTSLYGPSCLIVCGENIVSDPINFMNKKVIDQHLNPIGKVVNIFGSESQIYFLVRFFREFDNDLKARLVKQKLYISL
ncbi:MAG: hypothetical protein GX362_02035 [Methanosarcinaceae archaeon]|nr:hypothetical protein [Methanosarcinaceae archaeon]